MGRQKSYVAGVLDQLATLDFFIGEVIPEVLADEFLRSTLIDIPRPPWHTGALRRSGAVYIGNKKFLNTEQVALMHGRSDLLGANPDYPEKYNDSIGFGKWESENSPGSYSTPASLKLSKVKYKGGISTGRIDTLRGKVSVLYQAPHAELMHEWQGTFADRYSGAHFVSSKALMATSKAASRIQQLASRHIR